MPTETCSVFEAFQPRLALQAAVKRLKALAKKQERAEKLEKAEKEGAENILKIKMKTSETVGGPYESLVCHMRCACVHHMSRASAT